VSQPKSQLDVDLLSINTIRTLAIDAVQQANSGHPGAPMGLAPVVYELWQKFLRYDPADPLWPNRDRFVLSAGHASMLLYATLHLAGVRAVNAKGEVTAELAVPMDEIKRFRQIDSRTPGHPESHLTTGVETTTGPLGQGAGNSVGMAITSKWLAENFNRPGFDIFNFNVYAICGDGDLMEGVGLRGGLAGGPPEAAQSLLDLRQQPRNAGRSCRVVLQRGRNHAFQGLRLERDARHGRERP